ncbi:MAG: hypothetical protein H0W64_01075 [Gammaproteobacteria bacterium]|nr:hypothetical protein [Gammaproteobacteria bacterium]
MATAANHKASLLRLKKQLGRLQKKEELSRAKLKLALKNIRQLSKSYKNRLASRVRIMKVKLGKLQATTYASVADDIQKQLLRGLESKDKSLRAVIAKVERTHIAKLTKGIVSKAKKAKGKKVSSAKSPHQKRLIKRRPKSNALKKSKRSNRR